VTLSGTTTIEGGTVVKFSKHPTGNRLLITGSIDCRTDSYHPAYFIAADDDTVGELINNSTGNPGTNRYAGRAIELNAANTTYDLHDLRFRHPDKAIYVTYSSVSFNLSHTQIGYANYSIFNNYGNGAAQNLLVHDSLYGISSLSTTGTNRLEHATFHRVGTFLYNSWGKVYLTNSLLISVTNNLTYSGTNNAYSLSDSGIFQTVGSATHYLSSGSTNRDAGTTNINPTLLAELKRRTTYPPVLLTNRIAASTNLAIQAGRDTDLPDRGYHYDALDYVASQISVSNATVTLAEGVALGVYGASGSHGLRLEDGAVMNATGSPLNLCRFVRYNLVQEQANTNWSASSVGRSVVDASWGGSPRPIGQFKFTDWSTRRVDRNILRAITAAGQTRPGSGSRTASFTEVQSARSRQTSPSPTACSTA